MAAERVRGLILRRYRDLLVVPSVWSVDLLIYLHQGSLSGGVRWAVPICAAGVFATLLLRHRYPAYVLVLQLVWATAAGLGVEGYPTFTGVLLALHTVAARRRAAVSTVALLTVFIPFGVQSFKPADTIGDWLVSMLVAGLIATAAWGLGRVVWSSNNRADQLRAQQVAAAEQARRAERLRIARELHDIVAHAVSAMVLQAAGAHAMLESDPARAGRAMEDVRDAGTQAMEELRRMLGLLRSATDDGDDDVPVGQRGLADLNDLLAHARAAGLAVTLSVNGASGRLDPSVELTAYRCIQEALTNTMKHAGVGTPTQVSLTWSEERLDVVVEDDHAATVPTPTTTLSTGHGLLGLQERVGAVGGTFTAGPTSNGFRIHAQLPCARTTTGITQPKGIAV